MTIPFLCILAAFSLCYLTKIPIMVAAGKQEKSYDNKLQRDQQARLTGWGRRAVAAHLNSFEITPIFAGCVLLGHLVHGPTAISELAAITFVVSRIAYTAMYLADWDKARSLVWGLGLLCSFVTAVL